MNRYIDADKLKEILNHQYRNCHGYTGIKKGVYREALLAVKSAIHCQSVSNDMQSVVRCKDCKYLMFSDMYGECSRAHLGIVRPDDFCSYGERKDKECLQS